MSERDDTTRPTLRDPYTVLEWISHIDWYIGRIDMSRGPRRAFLLPEELEEIVELNAMRAIEADIDLDAEIGMDRGYEDPRLKDPGAPYLVSRFRYFSCWPSMA